MVILGLSLSSDSHASLLVNGEIRSCIGEERLSRIKNHIGFPRLAINEILEIEKINGDDIDMVTVGFSDYLDGKDKIDMDVMFGLKDQIDYSNEKPWWYRKEKIKSSLWSDISRLTGLPDRRRTYRKYLEDELMKLGISAPIYAVNHHVAHAMSAYYFSNKEKNLVITADGYGDGLSGAVFIGDKGGLKKIHSTDAKNSIGLVYSAATKFLGYKSHRHEGKLTGLAAYGNPDKISIKLHEIVNYDEKCGSFIFNLSRLKCPASPIVHRLYYYFDMIRGTYLPGYLMRSLLSYYDKISTGVSKEDIAAGTQKFFEDIYVHHVKHMINETGCTDLALAGGNFANVKLNQRLLQDTGATSVFIHPNMGDGGVAIGAAAYCYLQDKQKISSYQYKPRRLENVYLGSDIVENDLVKIAQQRGYYIHESINVAKEAAKIIADGYIVGRISGRMEYGPRSLGNRSIIAHPFNKEINDELNKRLSRTEFMPFAPSVLKEKAHLYYEGSLDAEYPAEFMTITLDVKEQGGVASAVNHIDNTARPHFVDNNNNPEYAELLKEFEKLSGYPILINTSFNRHEEPIVRTVIEALDRLEDESVQYLVVNNYIVRKSKNPISYIGSINYNIT